MLLISSRALLDAADMLEHSIETAPISDYAGRDVLCGLGGMRPAEADALTAAVVRATLLEVCAHLRAQADLDFDAAVAQVGARVRDRRRSARTIQHRRPQPRSPRRSPRAAAAAVQCDAGRRTSV